MLHCFGETISGRTLLQKRAFFVALLSGVDPGLEFDAHYYGPYSSTVDNTVTQLKNMGFVKEEVNDFGVISGGFEMRRYDYRLTEQGEQIARSLEALPAYQRVVDGVRAIREAGDPNYVELSIAAKAYFIISHQKRPMSVPEITKEAERYNWTIGEQPVLKAVNFLRSVRLADDPGPAEA
jgi:hypothetical protein